MAHSVYFFPGQQIFGRIEKKKHNQAILSERVGIKAKREVL